MHAKPDFAIGGLNEPQASWQDILQNRELFMASQDHTATPPEMLEIIWQGISAPTRKLDSIYQDNTTIRQDIHNATIPSPTLTEYRDAIRHSRANTVPGLTGLTSNMIRSWPDSTLEASHIALTDMYSRQEIPEWWKWRLLAPKPKITDKDVPLTALRPLMLIEVTRKIWMSILVHRIQRALAKHQLLHTAQHGYIINRGTDTAALELLTALEERKVQDATRSLFS